jgi:pimeloyl-ACP methyl ester carboxylesterase
MAVQDDVPMPHETASIVMSDGAPIILRRHGNRHGSCLAFSHGNGLAIDAYAPFWRQFCGRFDVIVFDMRNHGLNPPHGPEGHTWARMTLDLHELHAAVAAAFAVQPVAGVFHSLSAVAALRAAARHGPSWPRLILFDPPLYPRPGHELVAVQEQHLGRLVRGARRRPDSYAHWREFAHLLVARRQFARWRPGAHERFARATLREDTISGRFVLACPRELEAHIFETNRDTALWGQVAAGLDVPLSLVCADPSLDDADAPGIVCRALAQEADLDYECIPGTTHMLQLEEPDACAAAVLRRLDA